MTFVRLEIEAALARNIRVVPILVSGARMPRPSGWPGLRLCPPPSMYGGGAHGSGWRAVRRLARWSRRYPKSNPVWAHSEARCAFTRRQMTWPIGAKSAYSMGARLAGPSLPLDIGFSTTIPPGIRNAVILRDRRCRWPGGCHQPAAACEVHHVKHLAHGGATSLTDCVLLCSYHHQVVIHRWGWTLVLNPDGTTTAWNPDRTKVLHSHGPPARAG